MLFSPQHFRFSVPSSRGIHFITRNLFLDISLLDGSLPYWYTVIQKAVNTSRNPIVIFFCGTEYRSPHSNSLRAGLSGNRLPVLARFFAPF